MRVKDSFVTKALADARVQLAIAQIVQSELEEKLHQVSELNGKLELAEEKAKSLSEELERLKEERVKVDGKLVKKDKQLNALKQEMFHLSAAYGDLQATNLALERLNEKMRKEAVVSLERSPVIAAEDEQELQNEAEPLMMEDDTTSNSDVGVGVLETVSEPALEAAENDETAAHSQGKRRSARRTLNKSAAPENTKATAANVQVAVGRTSPPESSSQIHAEKKCHENNGLGLLKGGRKSMVVLDKHGIEHGFIRKRDDGRVACTCGKTFETKEFSKHLLGISVGKLFSCSECDFRCFSTWHLKRHLGRIHNQQSCSLFGCRKCGATFNNNADLNSHLVENHKRGLYL